MTWFETIAGYQPTWSRASAMSPETWLGAETMHLSAAGSRPASSAALRAVSMIHVMIAGSAGWVATPPPTRPPTPPPLELHLLLVPRDRAAVHERLDHRDPALELGHLHGRLADVAHGRVAASDPHRHSPVGDVVQRRVGARAPRRLARAGGGGAGPRVPCRRPPR